MENTTKSERVQKVIKSPRYVGPYTVGISMFKVSLNIDLYGKQTFLILIYIYVKVTTTLCTGLSQNDCQ